jgi:hypothetical protein
MALNVGTHTSALALVTRKRLLYTVDCGNLASDTWRPTPRFPDRTRSRRISRSGTVGLLADCGWRMMRRPVRRADLAIADGRRTAPPMAVLAVLMMCHPGADRLIPAPVDTISRLCNVVCNQTEGTGKSLKLL